MVSCIYLKNKQTNRIISSLWITVGTTHTCYCFLFHLENVFTVGLFGGYTDIFREPYEHSLMTIFMLLGLQWTLVCLGMLKVQLLLQKKTFVASYRSSYKTNILVIQYDRDTLRRPFGLNFINVDKNNKWHEPIV